MTSVRPLTPLQHDYPSRLRATARPPPSLSTRGGSLEAERVVAIVGSRAAHPETMELAHDLAGRVAQAGGVVVSGGAVGIDASAHLGAMDAGGRTWAVAPTGHRRCFPPTHADLFDRIGRGPGAMIWPFAPDYMHRAGFVLRNRILVALSDAVVVVQAGARSGALHAAACAVKLGKPLWVVPAPPWRQRGFEGTHALVDRIDAGVAVSTGAGAWPTAVAAPAPTIRPLTSVKAFLAAAALGGPQSFPSTPPAARSTLPPPPRDRAPLPLSDAERAVLRAMSSAPLHLDEIARRVQCPARGAAAALLTLALADVVVEGPPGFFRRRIPLLGEEDR